MPAPSFSEIARYRIEAPALRTIAVTHDLLGRHGRIAAVLQRHLAQLGRTKACKVLCDRAGRGAAVRRQRSCRVVRADHASPLSFSAPALRSDTERFR